MRPVPQVIAGSDKGTVGKITKVNTKTGTVIVEGVNIKTKHVKPTAQGETGQIVKKEFPVHHSNVQLYSTEKEVSSRIGYRCVARPLRASGALSARGPHALPPFGVAFYLDPFEERPWHASIPASWLWGGREEKSAAGARPRWLIIESEVGWRGEESRLRCQGRGGPGLEGVVEPPCRR